VHIITVTPPSPAPVVSYGYDLAGHPTSVSDTSAAIAAAVPPAGASVQYATSYSYDATNHPVGVNWTPAPASAAPSASSVAFGHAYNAANQRVGQTVSDNSWVNYPAATARTASYTANALNQYTAVGPVSPSYDGNGNLTSDGTFTFGYDAENRLTSASGTGNSVSYAFDAQGRRKTRTVNGTTTVFVTDADNREVLEYDGSSGAIQRWYAYNLGPNDVLSQANVVAGTRATLIPDTQGSIIASLDSGSGSLSKLGYLPYGKSTSAGPFGYTGQRVDVEMGGLYYYRARHYSPAWGRFLQVDPIGYSGGSNLYAYVNNDPLNRVDLSGLIVVSLGVSGEAYYIFGGGGGGGVYWDTATGQVGGYKTGELGIGIGLSVGVTGGVSQSLDTFGGWSTQARAGVGPLTGQANLPGPAAPMPQNGNLNPVTGGSASAGAGIPFDFTISASYTKPTCWFFCGSQPQGTTPQSTSLMPQPTSPQEQPVVPVIEGSTLPSGTTNASPMEQSVPLGQSGSGAK